jgi:hypothetical protein
MPQDIPFLVEAYNLNIQRWGNHEVDLVSHHYHEKNGNQPEISECIVMPNFEICKYGITKEDGTTMSDDEMVEYFQTIQGKSPKKQVNIKTLVGDLTIF